MPNQLLPKRWASQPQYPTGIDWGNPITQGITCAINCFGIDVITGTYPTKIGATPPAFVGNAKGMGHTFTGATWASGYINYGSSVTKDSLTTAGTVVLLVNITDVTVSQAIAGKSDNNGAQGWILECVAGGTLRSKLVSGTNPTISSSAGALVSNKWHVIAVSFDGVIPVTSGYLVYVDGVSTTTVNAAGTTGHSSNITQPFLIGSQSYQDAMTRDLNGMVNLGAVWNRVLSASEIASLSANPWQIFAPSLS